jgi:tetratricopeptide (TPR) repeat protein
MLAKLARRAELLARQRQIGEAHAMLDQAVLAESGCPEGDEKALLALAQAVLAFYDSQHHDDALDRILAALRYASLHASEDIIAEVEAWAGWICNTSSATYAQGIRNARSALRRASASAHAARARANFSLGAYWHFTGALDRAQPHYREALHHARAGADAQLNTNILRYMALLQVLDARVRIAQGIVDEEATKQAFVGLASADSVRHTFNQDSRDTQIALHTAELLRLTGQYQMAAELIESALHDGIATVSRWELAITRADLAVCLAHMGQQEQAALNMQLALALLQPGHDTYTHAAVTWNHAQWLALTGSAEAETVAEQATLLWEQYEREARELRALLEA